MKSSDLANKGPLSGIRVLDLTRVLAGPLCTMMLGDLGADVIKVERPGSGDETRGWGPPFDSSGESAYFLSVNRNKRSLAADLDAPEDQRLIVSLALAADVVVENFLPGSLARKSIDAALIMAQNSQLIWCNLTGYPDEPSRPGYDIAVQAESGWMSITGEPNGAPMKTGVALVDVLAGKDAAIAVLAALVARGRARSVEERSLAITLFGSATAALVNVAQNALVSQADARRWGNAHANLVPYQLFETRDEPVVIAVGNDAQWRALTEVLRSDSLREDMRFGTNAGRVTHRDACVGAVAATVRGWASEELRAACASAGVPVGTVRSVREVLSRIGNASPRAGMPSSVGGVVYRTPPTLGQHSEEIRRTGWAEV